MIRFWLEVIWFWQFGLAIDQFCVSVLRWLAIRRFNASSCTLATLRCIRTALFLDTLFSAFGITPRSSVGCVSEVRELTLGTRGG